MFLSTSVGHLNNPYMGCSQLIDWLDIHVNKQLNRSNESVTWPPVVIRRRHTSATWWDLLKHASLRMGSTRTINNETAVRNGRDIKSERRSTKRTQNWSRLLQNFLDVVVSWKNPKQTNKNTSKREREVWSPNGEWPISNKSSMQQLKCTAIQSWVTDCNKLDISLKRAGAH